MRTSRWIPAVAAALAAAAAVPTLASGQDPGAPADEGQKAKNIILFIGDGMGVTHITAARDRYYGAAGRLNMERLPTEGSVATWAVQPNSDHPEYVTDSASSATAWSSGVKTYNAALGKDAYKRVVPTLMELAKARRMRTGNVTTAEITDATPAGMMSHVSHRDCQGPTQIARCEGDAPIAEQVSRNNVADVMLGGGLARFEPDDQDALGANGYTVLGDFGDPDLPAQTRATQRVATERDLQRVTGANRRVIGLFNRANLTIEKYKEEHPESVQAREPSLTDMTRKSIELLSNSRQGRRNGFFLQAEGALIDKRSHANDAAQTLREIKEFDDAVAYAREWAARDGNTLVIVTADHECAGFAIVEKGTFTNAEAAAPPNNVDTTGASAEARNTANDSTPVRPASANVKDPARSTGPINGSGNQDPRNFAPATFRTADDPAGVQDGSPEATLWLSYLSGNHTGEDVKIFAYGPRSGQFAGSQDNTDLFDKMTGSLRAF